MIFAVGEVSGKKLVLCVGAVLCWGVIEYVSFKNDGTKKNDPAPKLVHVSVENIKIISS